MTDLDTETARLLALKEGTTPGPWEFWQGRFPESDIEDPDNFGVSTSDGGIITYAFPTEYGAGGDTKANARLIAAAPDMLDAIYGLQAENVALLDAIAALQAEVVALTARAEAAEAKVGRTPDYCYDPVEWECTMPWVNAADVAETALWQCDVARIATLVQGPEKWAIWSEDRDTIHWFNTEAEARAALREIGGGNGNP